MSRRVATRIFTVPDLEPLTASKQDRLALCAGCHGKPRQVNRRPLAVWIGKPSFRAPAVCVCHVCLTVSLFALGFNAESLADLAAGLQGAIEGIN